MNIQIFGTQKCRNTQKSMRWFKERRIKFQFINLLEKEMSAGEFRSVVQSVGGVENLIDKDSREYASIAYIADEEKEDKLFTNQTLVKTPVVRNARQATCGYQPDVWETWS